MMVFVSDSDMPSSFAACVQAASAVVSGVLQTYSHMHSSRSVPRRDGWRDTAAPRSVARQALPHQRSVISVVAMSIRCRATMHGVAQAFGHAREIGAAKSVSFKKNRRC